MTGKRNSGKDGDPGDSGRPDKDKLYVPSLVEAQAEVSAKRPRTDRDTTKTEPSAGPRPQSEQRLATLAEADATTEALYARHKKVYPRQVHGFFADLRVLMVAVTLGTFYGLPWLNWGADRQAFLIDLPGRKFNFFFWTFWPQDLFYLAVILILSALLLFFFTAIFGRVWCGFTCPQTVWTEVFLWIERKIDGDRMKQMKLARQPWNGEKIARRSAKYGAWVLFSLWTGFTFVGFFTPIRELAQAAFAFQLSAWETFWIFFYGFATFGNAGFLREQICLYMCPYARFQGAMFDPNTLIISYDEKRGEPRGARGRVVDPKSQNLGDCIDCTLCVQVCPTGIDIRDGLQYECIGCAACIDACDQVMDKLGSPLGLIRYSTETAMRERAGVETILRRFIRPRTLIYTAFLTALFVAAGAALWLRVPLKLDVIRDRAALVRELAGGDVENVFRLQVMNASEGRRRYRVSAEGLPGLAVASDVEFEVDAAATRSVALRLRAPAESLAPGSHEVRITLQAIDAPDVRVTEKSVFLVR